MEPDRDTTVLCASILGVPDLYAKAGDQDGHQALERCRGRLLLAAAQSNARMLKGSGDKLVVLAPHPDVASDAASAMQLVIEKLPKTAEVKLGMGVGIHHGPVIQKVDEVAGETVNIAGQLADKAGNGQILLTEATSQLLSPLYLGWMRKLDKTRFKGVSEDVGLCELVWRDGTATALAVPPLEQPPKRSAVHLTYRGNTIVRRRDKDVITIGRGEDCGVVVLYEEASRHHCSVERRSDKWVLVDVSTNGTFITIEGEKEIQLNREELVLSKKGWITLGQPLAQAKEVVEFEVEVPKPQ